MSTDYLNALANQTRTIKFYDGKKVAVVWIMNQSFMSQIPELCTRVSALMIGLHIRIKV